MFKNPKELISNYKGIVESTISLATLNVLNMVLPLITLPYTIRVVGLANYGAYSVVYTILQYVLLVSAYGFSFSTTQQIARNRDNLSELNRIFNATLAARFLLSVLPVLVFGVVCMLSYSSDYMLMYILGLGIVVGDNINPIWLFQGMEKMRYMTIINVISKLTFTILIFIIVVKEGDYIYLTLLNSLGYVVSGLFSLWIAYKSFNIRFHIASWKDILYQLKEGWFIFLSTICMNAYRNSNIFILSYFIPEASVGMYSAAEKMIKAAQSVASPISNAFYPYFANVKQGNNPRSILPGITKLTKLMAIILLFLSLTIFFGSRIINDVFLDPETIEPILLMQLMVPVVFFGSLNYILGIVGMINMEMKKQFFQYVMISGIISLIFLFVTVSYWGNISASLAMSISEIILFILCVYKLYFTK